MKDQFDTQTDDMGLCETAIAYHGAQAENSSRLAAIANKAVQMYSQDYPRFIDEQAANELARDRYRADARHHSLEAFRWSAVLLRHQALAA